ncbi:hypothetical protein KXJ69_11585 [Aureisphaera sp. CAU 1614]|uniref:Uncharacterized protein n=1 Tax=Halomarinibacterium sedimenti TaxID=2857106 RepID=A0A9X1FQC2_9FLAO|nr:hypothetical protein [Halomarinibacterium sedimenti]MBW2938754.1 hypothetical protein [Halomarinibacterium sedimenti]
MKKNLQFPVLGVLFTLLFFSCVKDTDFNQAQDVTITPIVELDLIYFNLVANDFFDDVSNTPRLTVRDTTDIRFLDDTDTQESLLKADFLFIFNNSIPRSFQADFQFLDSLNVEKYFTSTFVEMGTPSSPVITEFTESVEGEEILQLTQSDKVVVSVTIPSSDATLEGELNLKSKTTYYLEIKERD